MENNIGKIIVQIVSVPLGALIGFIIGQIMIFMMVTNTHVDPSILFKDIANFEFTLRWFWLYGRSAILSLIPTIGFAYGAPAVAGEWYNKQFKN